MARRRKLRLHLGPGLYRRAVRGDHAFSALIRAAFEHAGYTVSVARDTPAARLQSRLDGAFTITDETAPVNARSLVLRRAYVGAFWRLETTQKRWESDVARAAFDPESVPPEPAEIFFERWQKELFGAATRHARRGGFLLMPLQDRLLDQRSFQAMAPTQMIDAVCREGPDKPVVLTLHPDVRYSPEERAALDMLVARHRRLSISQVPVDELLRTCDAVICQNAAAAFRGYFFRKPSILFAGTDFHHIAARVSDHGVAGAFRAIETARPDYARYLFWFLRMHAIGAGQADATARIAAAARRAGWPLDRTGGERAG